MHRRPYVFIAAATCTAGAACSDPPPTAQERLARGDPGAPDEATTDPPPRRKPEGTGGQPAGAGGEPMGAGGDPSGLGGEDGGGGGDAGRPSPPGVVRLAGAVTTAACLVSPAAEDVTHLNDRDTNSKFLAFSNTPWAVFDAGAPYTLSHYALTSANDSPERDPVRWVLEGSNDAVDWTPLDSQSGQTFAGRLERREQPVNAGGFHRWFRLRMENAGGNVTQVAELELYGTTVFVTPAPAPPQAPRALRAEPVSRTQIALEWTDTSDDEAVFRIERADDGARFVAVGYVPAENTRFTVAGLEPGGRASYRVVAENAAGASLPSEVVVASPEPALVGRPGGGGLVYENAGYALTVIDDAPGITPTWTIARIIEEFFASYPRMAADYNPAAPRGVIVQFDPAYEGVAAAGGDHIRISSSYIAEHPDDIDVIVHEAFHLVQAYRMGNTPGWAVEGLADYARWSYGTQNNGACWSMQRYEPGQSHTDAYGVTARFFLWLATKNGPELLRALDATLRRGTYDDTFWTSQTGDSVDTLWAEYAADPMHPAVSYE